MPLRVNARASLPREADPHALRGEAVAEPSPRRSTAARTAALTENVAPHLIACTENSARRSEPISVDLCSCWVVCPSPKFGLFEGSTVSHFRVASQRSSSRVRECQFHAVASTQAATMNPCASPTSERRRSGDRRRSCSSRQRAPVRRPCCATPRSRGPAGVDLDGAS